MSNTTPPSSNRPPSTSTSTSTSMSTTTTTTPFSRLPSLSNPSPYHDRLSMPATIRILLGSTAGFAAGGALGVMQGAQTASYRYRAENTHRLPTSTKGWYLYHRSKNYYSMYYGVLEGLKMGARLGFWAGGFFLVESSVDHARGHRRDFLSSVVAGLSIAGGFSAVNRFSMYTAARTAKMGLTAGLIYGLAQDALSLAKGKRLNYVDFILRRKPEQTTENRGEDD